MRIVHALTYVSADGAYGGPVAVARAHCAELAARGHDVTLVAGWDGEAELAIPGVQVALHRVREIGSLGFAGMHSPALVADVRRRARLADVLHLHYARDLVQGPLGLLRHVPLVTQAHGMVRPDHRVSARVIDGIFVRPTYRRALHLVLTAAEVEDLAVVGRRTLEYRRIRNGVRLPDQRARWRPDDARVVFVARLHERKRPVAFVETAARLLASGHRAWFDLYGADEGAAVEVRAAIDRFGVSDAVRYHGPLRPEAVAAVLADAQVYVLPSRAEPFPMSLLEAMSHGLPAVITDDTGISDELRTYGAAAVTDGSPAAMAEAVAALLGDVARWHTAADTARSTIRDHFSTAAVADTLESAYAEAIRGQRPPAHPQSRP